MNNGLYRSDQPLGSSSRVKLLFSWDDQCRQMLAELDRSLSFCSVVTQRTISTKSATEKNRNCNVVEASGDCCSMTRLPQL